LTKHIGKAGRIAHQYTGFDHITVPRGW
jgi:hypothetical protein